jgi:hypothetical protein
MRSAVVFSPVLFLLLFGSAAAEECSADGSNYAEGASYCLSGVRDGKVAKVLFTCKNGKWTDANVVCPDRFAYFCQVGPHSVPIGEQLILGSGPAVLECKFPGVLSISQGSSAASSTAAQPLGKSLLVRDVQKFLNTENAGLDCSNDQCAGQLDDKTLAAVAGFVRQNFAQLNADDRKQWGVESQDGVQAAVLAKNPIDLIALFVKTFDVPKSN